MITEDTARRIASEWHSGQFSPLYKFSSSGYMDTLTIDDVDSSLRDFDKRPCLWTDDERAELVSLREYVDVNRPRNTRTITQNEDGSWIVRLYHPDGSDYDSIDSYASEREAAIDTEDLL